MANADIIQQALDILASDNTEVIVHLKGDEAFGGVAVRFGILTGLGSMGDEATITVFDMHDSSGFGPGPNGGQRNVPTLVDVREVILIKQNWHQV